MENQISMIKQINECALSSGFDCYTDLLMMDCDKIEVIYDSLQDINNWSICNNAFNIEQLTQFIFMMQDSMPVSHFINPAYSDDVLRAVNYVLKEGAKLNDILNIDLTKDQNVRKIRDLIR